MDLEHLSFEEVKTNAVFTLKSKLYAAKQEWVTTSYEGVTQYLDGIEPEQVENGDIGLYMKPKVMYYGAYLYFIVLDIEHPKKHNISIQANIETGQSLYARLDSYGLTDGLVVGLSGKGLRFTWPYTVPYRYTEAFRAFISDSRSFPGIDPAPQKNDTFIRTLAYRGTTAHGANPIDRHITYLDSASQLMTLNQQQYIHLTKGRPRYANYKAALPKLLPNQWITDEWEDLFQTYDYRIKLNSTIISPAVYRIQKSASTNWQSIEEALSSLDISINEHESGVYKLSSCPACGKREGNPYITPTGWLRCFRAVKCPAGQDGMAPSEWIGGYKAIYDQELKTCPETVPHTLEEARELLSEILDTKEHLCLDVTPGVGKTYAATRAALERASDELVLYASPTKELGREVLNLAENLMEEMYLSVNLHIIIGRDKDNCQKFDLISEVGASGFTPGYIICPDCEHKKGCVYHEQFEKAPKNGIIFTTHQMAKYLPGRIEPDLFIIDENPTQSFFNQVKNTQAEMDQLKNSELDYLKPLFTRISDAAVKLTKKISGYQSAKIYATRVPLAESDILLPIQKIDPVIKKHFEYNQLPERFSRLHNENQTDFQWENKVFKEGINLNTVKWWDAVIDEGGYATAHIKATNKGKKPEIKYVLGLYQTPEFENCQVIHLDGTMYNDEIAAVFGDGVKTVHARVSLNDSPKTWLRLSRGKIKTMQFAENKKEADVKVLLNHLRPQDKKVLILTYMGHEDEILNIAQTLRPDIEFGLYHFWGPKGVNAFEDFDACIAYGTPTVNPEGVVDVAVSLFAEMEEAKYWFDSLGKRELSQAVHRIRPVNGDKNIIIMGSFWPTEYLGQPDLVIDMMRKKENFEEAKKRLADFIESFGFITKEIAHMLGVGTRGDLEVLKTWQNVPGGSDLFCPDSNRVLYKSGDKIKPTPPSLILLPGNTEWKKLIEELHAAMGLPIFNFKSPGKGRSSLALGTLEKLQEFYHNSGSDYDLAKCWSEAA